MRESVVLVASRVYPVRAEFLVLELVESADRLASRACLECRASWEFLAPAEFLVSLARVE